MEGACLPRYASVCYLRIVELWCTTVRLIALAPPQMTGATQPSRKRLPACPRLTTDVNSTVTRRLLHQRVGNFLTGRVQAQNQHALRGARDTHTDTVPPLRRPCHRLRKDSGIRPRRARLDAGVPSSHTATSRTWRPIRRLAPFALWLTSTWTPSTRSVRCADWAFLTTSRWPSSNGTRSLPPKPQSQYAHQEHRHAGLEP